MDLKVESHPIDEDARYLQSRDSLRTRSTHDVHWTGTFKKLVIIGKLACAVDLLESNPGNGRPMDLDEITNGKSVRQIIMDKHPEDS
ncbi:hypothetical protein GJ496_000144 [Pomphorhynchus laevis]|nr:hypothetical protein GJ496_000144 [Pomphorhynchus laevis]